MKVEGGVIGQEDGYLLCPDLVQVFPISGSQGRACALERLENKACGPPIDKHVKIAETSPAAGSPNGIGKDGALEDDPAICHISEHGSHHLEPYSSPKLVGLVGQGAVPQVFHGFRGHVALRFAESSANLEGQPVTVGRLADGTPTDRVEAMGRCLETRKVRRQILAKAGSQQFANRPFGATHVFGTGGKQQPTGGPGAMWLHSEGLGTELRKPEAFRRRVIHTSYARSWLSRLHHSTEETDRLLWAQ